MYTFLLILHVIGCVGLIISILMQSSKGGGLSGVFGGGGGGMGSVFGGRGVASFLSKLTTILAIAFFVICLILGKITGPSSGNTEQSAIQKARVSRSIPVHAPKTQTSQPGQMNPGAGSNDSEK